METSERVTPIPKNCVPNASRMEPYINLLRSSPVTRDVSCNVPGVGNRQIEPLTAAWRDDRTMSCHEKLHLGKPGHEPFADPLLPRRVQMRIDLVDSDHAGKVYRPGVAIDIRQDDGRPKLDDHLAQSSKVRLSIER